MHSPRLSVVILACVVALAGPALAQPDPTDEANPGSAALLSGSIEWNTLSVEQRQALRPLSGLWHTLHPSHQRKWIALAHNFNRMGSDEQSTLQGRMAEWAKLTSMQRTEARLNFGEVRRVPADEKRAKWEEYQALPAEERERLAKKRPVTPVGVAPALRPAPADRIVRSPAAVAPFGAANPVTPVNRNTLLPQPHASAPKPEASAPKPEASAPQPEASAPQPEASAPQPEASAPQPER
ncbi:MAG: DUF3106 domain-containing protein [Burkholderiaceae bacterium]|jgi:hypothetical protein|nr:DUF3106 domain-containing protein [Burkholderiaceae bacterium]